LFPARYIFAIRSFHAAANELRYRRTREVVCSLRNCRISRASEVWAATNVVIDVTTGAVTSDEGPLFAGIEIVPGATENAELAVAA
jgi:hypothetical protein